MDIIKSIVEKIKQYDRIIITRHIRPDGDCIGSSMGLRSIIKTTFPDKEVYCVADDEAEYVKFFNKEDKNDESYSHCRRQRTRQEK